MEKLSVIWSYVIRGLSALWVSVVALVKSPSSIWLAGTTVCVAVFVGGFMTGHWERNIAVKALKADVVTLTTDRDNIAKSYRDLSINASKALKEARDAKAELEAARKVLESKSQSAARSGPAKPKTKEALK